CARDNCDYDWSFDVW
nr:immunoglobulin heavy chain junction region [Mus musculus]